MFLESVKRVSKKFLGCSKSSSRIIQESFKGLSTKFQGGFMTLSGMFRECFLEFAGGFPECFKEGSFNKIFNMFHVE